eukprot:Gb_33470 [translate_table: standard]
MKKGGGNHSHSWWWDSHINPKNSKWLEENLEGMDTNVKTMLKLIEEDADSFAKKAEMYYKKRPELISLVEESFRIYRSLAERYDHLTGELRKNIPSSLKAEYGLSDDSSPGSQHDVKTKSKRRAARFDFFLGSSSTDHSRKSADSSDESSSTASSDTEPEDSLKPHLELQRLKEENEKQRTEFEKVKEEYEGLQQKIRELQEGILNLKEENEFLRKEAAGESGHRENLQEQITGLEARNSDLESQIRSILVEVGDSAGKIVVLQKEDEKLTEELQSEVKINQELEREIQDLQVKLFSSQEENNVSKLEFQRCLEDYRVAEKRISEIETDTSAQKEQIYTLESEIDDLKHKLGEMQEENNVLSMQNEVGIQKLNYAEREIKKLQEEVLKLQGEKEKLSGEVVENEAQKKDMRAELSFLQEDNGRLRNELVIMQQRMKDHEDAMSHLLMEKENIRNEASGQMDSMQDQLRYLEKELQSRTEKVQVLEKHTEELQLTLLDSQSENARLTGEYNRGIDEYDALNERLKALQEELLHTQEENERLRKENSAKILDLNDLEALYSSLIKKKEQLDAELLLKGNMMGEMAKELNDLKEQNQILSRKLEASTQEQKEQIRVLQETIIGLQDQNKTLTDQFLGSLEKQHELETRFRDLEEENRRLQSELADLRVAVQKWEKDAHILESEKAALESGIISGKEQLNALKDKCRSFCGDVEHLANQLQDEREQLRKENSAKIFDLNDLEVLYSSLIEEKERLEAELLLKGNMLGGMEKDLNDLKEQNKILKLEASTEEHKDQIRALQETIIDLQDQNKTLTDQLLGSLEKHRELEIRFKCVEEENGRLQSELADMRVVAQKWEKDVHILESEKAALESGISSGKKQLNALKGKCRSFYGDVEHLASQLQHEPEQLRKENSAKFFDLNDLEVLYSILIKENERLDAELLLKGSMVGGMEKHLNDLKEQNQILSFKLEASTDKQKEQIRALQETVIDLQDQNKTLTDQLLGSLEKHRELETRFKGLEEENGRLQSELVDLRVVAQKWEKDAHILESKKAELQSGITSGKEQLNALKEKCRSFYGDAEHLPIRLQDEPEQLRKENSTKTFDLNDLEVLYSSLIKDKERLQAELLVKGSMVGGMEKDLNDLKEQNQISTQEQKEQIRALQETIIPLQDQNKTLTDQLLGSLEKQHELETRFKGLEEENRRLQSELADLRVVAQKWEKDAHILESEKAALESGITSGKVQLNALKEKCCSFYGDAEHLAIQLQDEPEQLRKENSAKTFDLNDLEVLYSNLIKEKERLGAELLLKGSMVGGMQNDLNDLKEQNEILSSKLQASTEEQKEQIRALQETIIDLKDQNKTLTDQLLGALEKHHELETKFRDIEEENRRLQSELADLKAVAQKWETDAHILESEKAALESGITSGKEQLNALKEKCCSFYGDAEHLAIQLQAEPEQQKTFDKEILDVEQLILHIKEVYVNLKTKSHEGSEVCQKLTEELAELQKELIFVRSENNSLKLEISNQEELVKKLNTDYISLHNENETLKNEISNGVDQIQKFEEEYKDLRKKTEEMAALQSEVTSGKEQLHALKEICHSFYGNAEQLTIQLQAKQEQQKTFNEEVLELEQLIFCIKEEYMHFKTKFHERSEVCQKLTGELEDLEKELLVVHSENNSLKLEKSNQEEFVKKLNTDCISLHSENEKLNNEISNGIDQIQKLKKECDNLRNRLEEMARLKDEENLILQKSLHNLQEENEKLRGELQNAFKDNEKNLFVVKEELLQWRDKNTNLEQQVISRDDIIEGLKDRVDMLHGENKNLEAEVEHINMQKCKLEEDVSSLQELKAELERENTLCRDKEKTLEADVYSLQEENTRLANISQTQTIDIENHKFEIEKLQNEMNKFALNCQRGLEELEISEKRVQHLQENLSHLEGKNEELNNLLSIKSSAIQKLEDEVSSLEQEKIVLKSEVGALTEQIKNLQSLICELEQYKEKTSEALVMNHEHVHNLDLTVQELEQLTGSMKLEKTTLEADYQEVCEQLKACQHMLKVLQEEHSGLADQRNSLLSEVSSKRAYICKLEEEVLTLQQENSAKVNDINLWGNLGAKLREELGKLQEERRKLESEFLDKVSGFKDDVWKLQEAFDSLKEENLKIKSDCQTMTGDYLTEQKRVVDLQEQKMALDEKSRHILEDLGKAEGRAKLLQKQLSDLQEENSQLRNNASETVVVTQTLKEGICMLESDKCSLQTEMLQKVDEIDKLNEEFAHIRMERDDLKGQLQVKAEQIQKLELEIERLQNELISFDEENKHLLDESHKLIEEKNTLRIRTDELLHDVSQLETEKDDIQKDTLERMQQIKTFESTINSLKDDNRNLETQVKSGREEILGLQKHLHDLHLEHVSLISASQAGGRQIEELQLKVGKLETEVKELREESERQSIIIFDRAEEKREAIRQLCFSIDHFRHNYKHLQQILSTIVRNRNRTATS